MRGTDRQQATMCCSMRCTRRKVGQRAAVDGAARLQSAVSLVCRAQCRLADVGPGHVQQESRPAIGRRDRADVLRPRCRPGAGAGAALCRALHCRWHVDRSLGSLKTFRPKDEKPEDRPPPDDRSNPSVNFHRERRSNATHQSMTDPDARLATKGSGQAAKLSYAGHVLMENRHGLVVDAMLTLASGTAERDAGAAMLTTSPTRRRATLGADKAYDTRGFVTQCRALDVTPHVAQNTSRRRSAIDARTTRDPGYALSQRLPKRAEEIFGWMKTIGLMRKTRHRGKARVRWQFSSPPPSTISSGCGACRRSSRDGTIRHGTSSALPRRSHMNWPGIPAS